MQGPIWLAFALIGVTAADAPSTVTVEIVSVGHVETPANLYVLSVTLQASGDTEPKARQALEAAKAALFKKLAAVGAKPMPDSLNKPPEKLITYDDSMTVLGNEMIDNYTSVDVTPPPEKPTFSQGFAITSASRAAIAQAQDLIARTEGASATDAPYSFISDVPAARRAAKRNAIEKARLDAQTYADTLGYAGATVTAVSERNDIGTLFTMFSSAIIGAKGRPAMFEPSRGDTVATDVTVIVTFRLDGKK
jgi:uncharacterized protein YggE